MFAEGAFIACSILLYEEDAFWDGFEYFFNYFGRYGET